MNTFDDEIIIEVNTFASSPQNYWGMGGHAPHPVHHLLLLIETTLYY